MTLEYRNPASIPATEVHLNDERSMAYLSRKIAKNALLRSTSQIDSAVSRLHATFPIEADADQFASDSLVLRAQLDQVEAQLDTKPKMFINITDYFRLASVHDFAVEAAAIEAAFSSTREIELRETLSNGIAGKSVARVEQALHLYDNSLNPFRKANLRGVIAEQLALTLSNFSDDPNIIALPGTVRNDLLEKTDMRIYHFKNEEGHVTPVQIKSGKARDSPSNGFTINKDMMGYYTDQFPELDPKQDFQLARTFVKLMSGEGLNESENTLLETSVSHFETELHIRLAYSAGKKV
ncbi:hypothetical protein HY312_00010 [Candidatus Saccharibacteria bacterium]|nr:hypothetical protein [Candidatus Saccharibacteria bacterium]